MDEARIQALRVAGALTARQAGTLRRLLADGITEPSVQGATPAQCKLW